jgi:hypothetical protein
VGIFFMRCKSYWVALALAMLGCDGRALGLSAVLS